MESVNLLIFKLIFEPSALYDYSKSVHGNGKAPSVGLLGACWILTEHRTDWWRAGAWCGSTLCPALCLYARWLFMSRVTVL